MLGANHSIPGETWGSERGGDVLGVGNASLGEVGGKSVGSSWLSPSPGIGPHCAFSPLAVVPGEHREGLSRPSRWFLRAKP